MITGRLPYPHDLDGGWHLLVGAQMKRLFQGEVSSSLSPACPSRATELICATAAAAVSFTDCRQCFQTSILEEEPAALQEPSRILEPDYNY